MSRHLAFEISDSHLKAGVFRSGILESTFETSLISRVPAERRDRLDELIKENSFNSSFDQISMGVVTKRSTIVPSSVFAESKPGDIYRLCFGQPGEELSVDYNRIAEHSIVNVYDIASWIKSYFVLKFPQVVIQHSGTHLVRQSMDQNTFRTKVTVELFDGHFHMNIVKHGKLEYYSHFDYTTTEDVIYHLFFVLQQKELLSDQGSIIIGSGREETMANAILEGLEKVTDLKAYSKQIEKNLHLKAQLLCV